MKAELTKSSVAAFVVLCFTAAAGLQAQINAMSIGDSSGSYADIAGVYTVTDASLDIWGPADGFQFVYQRMRGNGQITARVVNQGAPSDPRAKTGVMIRETLAANSRHAMMVITGDGRTAFQHRKQPGGLSYSAHANPGAAPRPYWVRIVRNNNTFTGYHSFDGMNWIQQDNFILDGGPDALNPANIDMPEDVYVGLCVTSHNPDAAIQVEFDNVIWPGSPIYWPLYRPYWFLDAKLLLYYAPVWTYRYTGFWGGWYPYYYFGRYYYPWYGPVYCHPCCWPLRWHYWWWQWPWRTNCYYSGYWYQGCWWWWHPWGGGPHFWGFLNRINYRYWYPQPRTTFWWSWYWWYNGRGYCMEIVTLGDRTDQGRVLPLDNAVLDNLEVQSHEFNVNGGKQQGEFSLLERIPVSGLREYYLGLGAGPEELAAFEQSDVYQNLTAHSGPEDDILVQWTQFPLAQPEILITQSDDSTMITEGGQGSYEISFAVPPEADTIIVAEPNVNSGQIDLGNGPGNPIFLRFSAGDMGPKTVTITAVEDDVQERSELAVITHMVVSEDPQYDGAQLPAVPVSIVDNELGAWGYFLGDINHDGYTNFIDVALVADSWGLCTNPGDPACFAISQYCHLDVSSFYKAKCWGECGAVSGTCGISWRSKGSEDPWETLEGAVERLYSDYPWDEFEFKCTCKKSESLPGD